MVQIQINGPNGQYSLADCSKTSAELVIDDFYGVTAAILIYEHAGLQICVTDDVSLAFVVHLFQEAIAAGFETTGCLQLQAVYHRTYADVVRSSGNSNGIATDHKPWR